MGLNLEKAAELGWHLVHAAEGLARFERVHAAGTQRLDASSVDAGLAEIDANLATHPGATVANVSRSDGASESLDTQLQHSALYGPTDLPTPAAAQEAARAAELVEKAAPARLDQSVAVPVADAVPAADPAAPADPEAAPVAPPAEPVES